jgi:hypothetical protein
MALETHISGVIRGKSIELVDDPGLQAGQEVEVTLRPTPKQGTAGEGILRAAGALADSWQAEDDRILSEIQASRGCASSG